MVDDGMRLIGRGRTPTEPDPLLSVDAIEGCRMRSIVGAETALCHGTCDTVLPLELLCELDGPCTSGDRRFGRIGPVSCWPFLVGSGDAGGELNGAIAFGTLVPSFEFTLGELVVSIGDSGDNGALLGSPFCGDTRNGFLWGTESGAMEEVRRPSGDAYDVLFDKRWP